MDSFAHHHAFDKPGWHHWYISTPNQPTQDSNPWPSDHKSHTLCVTSFPKTLSFYIISLYDPTPVWAVSVPKSSFGSCNVSVPNTPLLCPTHYDRWDIICFWVVHPSHFRGTTLRVAPSKRYALSTNYCA